MREYTEKSLANIGVSSLDLQQFHVWNDEWAGDDRWQRAVRALKDEGLVKAFGISVNRFAAGERAARHSRPGLMDAVQVVYNVSIRTPRTSCSPPAGSRTSQSSPAIRSTRDPDRNADAQTRVA